MSEEIGEFKVKIIGEVDANSIESNFEKSAGNMGKALQKHLSQASKVFSLPGLKGGIIGKGITKTSEAAGGLGGLGGLVTKLGALISIVSIVSSALMSLAPIQAILKMISTVLQLTLYPIATLLLTIFKPIFAMLLKYLILPFYYDVMPILKKFGESLAVGIVGQSYVALIERVIESVKILIEGAKAFVEVEILKIKNLIATLTWVWDSIKTAWDRMCTWFTTAWADFWDGIGTTLSDIWTGISDGVTTILSPLINAVKKVFSGISTSIIATLDGIFKWIRKSIPFAGTTLDKLGITAGTDSSGGGAREIPVAPGSRTLQIISEGNDRWKAILDGNTDSLFSEHSTWDMLKKLLQQKGIPDNVIQEAAASQQVQTFAHGGIVTQPTIGLIGEAGAEAVIPLSKMNKFGTTVNNTFNIGRIEKDVDIDDIVRRIERTFYVNMKRA